MDIVSDGSRATLYRIVKSGAPEYVMEARPVSCKEASAELADTLFADRSNRRYPIDSKASTWLSAAYFAKTASDDGYDAEYRDQVRSNILNAASLYGNRADVEEVMSRFEAPAEKTAAAAAESKPDESCYGWPAERKYPMFDEEGVKLANDYFSRNAYKYPAPMRRQIAGRILSKCAEYGVEPDDTVRAEAHDGWNKRDFVGANLAARAEACGDPEAAMEIAKMAEAVVCAPPMKYPSLLEKIAENLEAIDAVFGFDRMYEDGSYLPPAQVCFGLTMKTASDLADGIVEIRGRAFDANALAGLPIEVYTGALGDGFAGVVVKKAGAIDPKSLVKAIRNMSEEDRGALYGSIVDYTSADPYGG